MTYIPDPTNPSLPTVADLAGNMAAELQALKGYIQSLIATGTNFYNLGASSFRNRLKNGSMNVAQRGRVFNVGTPGPNSVYTYDQWKVDSNGGSTHVSDAAGPTINSNVINLAPAGGVTTLNLYSRIESADVQDMVSGTFVTVSGMIKITNILSSAILGPPIVNLYTPGSSATPDVWTSPQPASSNLAAGQPIGVQSLSLNNWLYFSNTFLLNTDCTAGLECLIQMAVTTGDLNGMYYNFTNIMLEKATVGLPYEHRPIQVDTALCQRYYQNLVIHFEGYGITGTPIQYIVPHLVPIFPSITITPTLGTVTNLTGATVAADVQNNSLFTATVTAAGNFVVDGSVAISGEL